MSDASQQAEWVEATATHNYVLGDPLLDWLEHNGEAKGFERDQADERTDYGSFVRRKGREFEDAVVQHLRSLDLGELVHIPSSLPSDRQSTEAVLATATEQAISAGVPLVHQGMLRDPQTRTHGSPDLLVRSDVLAELFPESITAGEAAVSAAGLDGCHYVVVDIKYATLHLNAAGGLGNVESSPAYKAQLFIYNRALAEFQGYLPPNAYLLGRGWEQKRKGEPYRSDNCMDLLAPVAQDGNVVGKETISSAVEAAVDWVRRLRAEGASWEALPEPSVPELRPSAKRDHGEWSGAVKRIVEVTEDLSSLYWVSTNGRDAANERGITRWSDPRLTPAEVGVTGSVVASRLQSLLDVNRGDGPPVAPATVNAAREQWFEPAPLEFYVDFETVNDLDDRFDSIPVKGSHPLIFMIGCGHLDGNEWLFECFVADELNEQAEAEMIGSWVRHMASIAEDAEEYGSDASPRIIHWSDHEPTYLDTAHNAASRRNVHIVETLEHLEWFDFLKLVVQAEPVAVRGAHAFGLKAVTNALCDLGLIETRWGAGPADGLGAMVGAWWCQQELERGAATKLLDLPLMQEIREYNEVDCRAMMEIVRYLRQNH